VIGVLAKGVVVEKLADAPTVDWWQVKQSTNACTGFVARRFLSPLSTGGETLPGVVNQSLWDATVAGVRAHVGYLLGAKDIAQGVIDCSGWVDHLTWSAFDVVNALAAPEVVFSKDDYAALRTHSDGIIVAIEARTGKALHGPDVTIENLREGMLIGVNFGDFSWEKGSPPRVYGINHIVQVLRSPISGELFISQSSHSGHGVNTVLLAAWLAQLSSQGLLKAKKIHAADPFLLADRHTSFMTRISAQPQPSLTSAPATSSAVGSVVARVPAFTGRGVYVGAISEVLARYKTLDNAIAEMKRCGFKHVWVRIHGRNYVGGEKGGQPETSLFVGAAKQAGFAVAGWGWCQGDDISAESNLAIQSLAAFGLDAYVADIEQGVNGSKWTAPEVTGFLMKVRSATRGLGVTSHGFIDWFAPEIFKGAQDIVDCFDPQAYWYDTSPSKKMLASISAPPNAYALANSAGYAQLCLDRYRHWYGRPVVLTGQAYSEKSFTHADAEAKLGEFMRAFQNWSQPIAINWWHLASLTQAMRDTLAQSRW